MGKKSKGKDKADRKARKRAAQRAAEAGLEQTAPTAGADVPTVAPGATTQSDRRAVGSTELAARLASLSTVLQRHLARADAGDGLTRARLSALSLLVLGGPRTLGDLATAERVRPPTMTRLVQAMEADGLVVRERNPSDARSIIIRATPLGERQLDVGRARQIAPLAGAITLLAGSDRRQLDEAVDLLGRVLRDTDWELDAIPE
jgi:DNA-binding MarR family transcriptional regulator